MSDRGDPALIGRTVAGKFVVEKFLGGGAMGEVYRARQVALEKNVALKVMNRAVAVDPSFVARFHREAKAASRLDHPNSMRVIDFGEEPDGLLYIAMEYLEGRDLFRVMQEDWPLPVPRIVDIAAQALAAVAVAHDMGVIHRDLKPENIMVLRAKDDEGTPVDLVKVCDFGIAKITEADEKETSVDGSGRRLTTQGLVVGTPEYMSPEQARGEKLDARSDIYSLGIILYQLLTGRTPFAGDTALAVVLKHISEEPPPPRTIYPAVHEALEAVCMKALAKRREDRYQTAREMRGALRAAVYGGHATGERAAFGSVTPPARSVPPASPTPSRSAGALRTTGAALEAVAEPRRRATASVAVAVLALLVGAGSVVGYRLAKRTPPTRDAPHAVATSESGRVTAIDIKPTSVAPPPPVGSAAPTPARDGRPPRRGAAAAAHKTALADGVPSGVGSASPPGASEDAATVAPAEPGDAAVVPAPGVSASAGGKGWSSASCHAQLGVVHGSGGAGPKDLAMNGTQEAWNACTRQGLRERPAGPLSATVRLAFHKDGTLRAASCPECPPSVAQCVAAATPKTVSASYHAELTNDPVFEIPISLVCEP